MIIDVTTIQQAFHHYDEFYVRGRRWTIQDTARLWELGRRAFSGDGERIAFYELYGKLRRYWQVFRGPVPTTSDPRTLFSLLLNLAKSLPHLVGLRLSELSVGHVLELEEVLAKAGQIKMNKGGPSLVAVSKFLHFWNPRLFVIIDDEVMGRWVLRHRWIDDEVRRVQRGTPSAAPPTGGQLALSTAGGLQYLDALLWASGVMRDNPAILTSFVEYLREALAGDPGPSGCEEFEGAAVEWLLLGLVEVPPAGVRLATGDAC